MEYLEKFNLATKNTVYFLLNVKEQALLKDLALKLQLSVQDIKIISEILKDLSTWDKKYINFIENLLANFYSNIKTKSNNPKIIKNKIISEIKQYYENAKSEKKKYIEKTLKEASIDGLKCIKKDISSNIFGACPVYSEKTVCCGLKTLDVVQNCPFNCSYCTIQTFYGNDFIFVNNLKEKLNTLNLDKKKFYHIGTGQSSDALVWGNKYNILDELINFAKNNPNVLLELKTKSSNISYFKDNIIPKNIVCSWTINTNKVIQNEELGTASLESRLNSAKQLANHGIKIAFHFHPIIFYEGLENEYNEIAQYIQENFSPKDISFISFGSLTFIKPVIKQIREKKVNTKILQMPTALDPNGKITYPKDLKIYLYKMMYENFKKFHDKVFFYLCMETRDIWQEVFSFCYKDNEEFLQDFGLKTLNFK